MHVSNMAWKIVLKEGVESHKKEVNFSHVLPYSTLPRSYIANVVVSKCPMAYLMCVPEISTTEFEDPKHHHCSRRMPPS
jgi:hypothetical protein